MELLLVLTLLDSKNRLENFKTFNILYDSIQEQKEKNDKKFAFIRFGSEELKKINAEKEVDILKRNISLGVLTFLLIGSFFWYKKRKKRLEQEKELEIKNTQLKISQKVHDVVANGIYQVMSKIENQESFNKDEALDELEFVYEKSRDISYEKPELKEEEKNFKDEISDLIASFKNEHTQTYTVGNENTIWKELKPKTKENVYQIIRELLVNMKKHSKADRVILKFEKNEDFITIQYSDNGIGISGDIIHKNGLRNTGNRIEEINGKIIFDTKTEKGLKVNISFPAS